MIGHSYGSTEVGAAATGGHHLDVNNVIAVGSPGMLSHHAGDLNLDAGATVYGMRARNDIIEMVTDLTLGHDPAASEFGGTRLVAAPGPSSDPVGLTPSVAAHSSYWDYDNPALRNMGAVIAGVPAPKSFQTRGTLGAMNHLHRPSRLRILTALLIAMLVGACSHGSPLGPPTPTGATVLGGTPMESAPAPPPGWKLQPVVPETQQQAQDALIGYLTKTLQNLPREQLLTPPAIAVEPTPSRAKMSSAVRRP
ncbi:hypothetical protein NIIDMKKI_56990 [Mycobacterium kansasii]|uniref:DUF1023 domain-containing protein n=1 Tax=Mycobacterium kansasii TaxID=1768 RepID=A0A7G1IKN6_MYCKA|nr:hypothetical protein NIIDMKKI_56990 [Mycobacterium kansasii]